MPEKNVRIKVRLILYDRGNILLLKQTKPNGGNYSLVGGNIDEGEYAKDALIRESFEEAGITLEARDLELVHVLQKNTSREQRLVLYFKAIRWSGKARSRERDKFKSAEWFDVDRLPKNLTATVKHVMREYRRGTRYSEIRGKKK
ncbi:MAG: NUDIX hydrolase [Saprospiraceae bacterium]|nr:NUDIX hydrolase [Lewinella sp.]